MEIFIFILIYGGLLYVIYKFAESKNREIDKTITYGRIYL